MKNIYEDALDLNKLTTDISFSLLMAADSNYFRLSRKQYLYYETKQTETVT